MKTYSVLFAEDIPHYGTAEIEAENDAAAIEAAKAYALSEVTNDPAWDLATCKRIVDIHDAEGHLIAEEIGLDNCFLRYGGEKERRLCEVAPELLGALEGLCNGVQINAPARCKAYIISDQRMAEARAAIAKAKGE